MALILKSIAEVVGDTVVKESVFEEEIVVPVRKFTFTRSQLLQQKENIEKSLQSINEKLALMSQLEEENGR